MIEETIDYRQACEITSSERGCRLEHNSSPANRHRRFLIKAKHLVTDRPNRIYMRENGLKYIFLKTEHHVENRFIVV